MTGLLRGYGAVLTGLFFALTLGWVLFLIVLPQLTMAERALTAPKRQLDSSIAATLARDAQMCMSVLERYRPAATPAPAAGPSAGVPAIGGIGRVGVPAIGGGAGGAARPYVIQCDRTTTAVALVRPGFETVPSLGETYDLPALAVTPDGSLDAQIAMAGRIRGLALELAERLRTEEARAFPYTLANFGVLVQPRLIPETPAVKAAEDARLANRVLVLAGLRFDRDGQTWERIGLVTLARTIAFAMAATALALVMCYPVAYKVALAARPAQAVWLFMGLVIPYAIVEIMRVYAWTTIIDNEGVLNSALEWAGLVDAPIQFKRMPGTIFLVIVYTYVLFMVFPIYNVMSTLDRNQIEAAEDLGARAWRVHWRVIIPHAKPGIAVGCIATFMLAAGAFSVPRIISRGLQAEWFAQTIYDKFFESENSNIGAAYSFTYTLVCFLIVALFMWAMRTRLKDFARVQ